MGRNYNRKLWGKIITGNYEKKEKERKDREA